MILFKILTGEVFQDGLLIGHGYAGNGAGLNNPDACNQKMIGPLPQHRVAGLPRRAESVRDDRVRCDRGAHRKQLRILVLSDQHHGRISSSNAWGIVAVELDIPNATPQQSMMGTGQ